MSDLRANSVISDAKKIKLEKLNQQREEFKKKVEARKAELANSATDESFQDAAARVEAMREELYKIDTKRKKSKNEERDKLNKQYNELYELLRIEESAVGISHRFDERPNSYFRKRRIKRIILTISIMIVAIATVMWIMR